MTIEIKDTTVQDHHRVQAEHYALPFMDADTGPHQPVPRHRKAKVLQAHAYRVRLELRGDVTPPGTRHQLTLIIIANSVEQAVNVAKWSIVATNYVEDHPGTYWVPRRVISMERYD